jgi:hypothetical protein
MMLGGLVKGVALSFFFSWRAAALFFAISWENLRESDNFYESRF